MPKSETDAMRDKQRAVQAKADANERPSKKAKSGDQGAMQAGARNYPEPPFPAQHLTKPGKEGDLDPAPMYDAPYYEGSNKLKDKVAVITGADSGIGRAVAVLYAREGANVAVLYLSEDDDADTTREAVELEGRECLTIRVDIANRKSCDEAVSQVIETWGRVDVLVNNAGFQLHADKFEDITEERFDLTVKTNLYGMFHMIRACLPHMAKGSAIINTGSVTGLEGSKHLLDYSMTKGGIHTFTRSLSGHLLERGIRVNAVAPGPVWTPLNPADQPAEKVKEFGASSKMRRPAQPEEIAPAFVFLASPQCSSYITGEIVPVIGGY